MGIKERRTLKIGYVDDSQDHLDMFGVLLQHNPQELGEIDFKYNPIHVGPSMSHSELLQLLKIDGYEFILLDHKLNSFINAEDIASSLKYDERAQVKKLPKIISFTATKPNDPEEVQKLQNIIDMMENGLIEGRNEKFDLKADKLDPDIFYKIRKLAWKPLNIGVWGFGKSGQELVRYLCRSDSIHKINVGSAHAPTNKSIYMTEKNEHSEKIYDKQKHLDAVLEDADIFIDCSSTLLGKDIVEKAKGHPDRLIIFPDEYGRIMHESKIINNLHPDCLLFIFYNPIGPGLEIIRHGGMNPYKLTSSSTNDTDRLRTTWKEQFGKDKYFQNHHTLGLHGVPRYVISGEEMFTDKEKEKIKQVEKKAENLPYDVFEGLKDLGTGTLEPQIALLEFFEDFAHYRKNPRSNAYCYTDFEYKGRHYSGYVYLPALFDYKTYTIHADEEKIDEIGRDRVYETIIPFLEAQDAIIEKTLREKSTHIYK